MVPVHAGGVAGRERLGRVDVESHELVVVFDKVGECLGRHKVVEIRVEGVLLNGCGRLVSLQKAGRLRDVPSVPVMKLYDITIICMIADHGSTHCGGGGIVDVWVGVHVQKRPK